MNETQRSKCTGKMNALDYIETPRLMIRPVQLGDEGALNKAINNSLTVLQKWMPWAKDPSMAATLRDVQRGVFAWLSGTIIDFPMVITDKKKQHIIGASGYNDQSNPSQGLYEVGYWIDIDYQGHGYATECTNALTRYALCELAAKKVNLSIQVNNSKSLAVAKRLHFINEGNKERDPLDCVNEKHTINTNYSCSSLGELPQLKLQWAYQKTSHKHRSIITWATETLGIIDNKTLIGSKVLVQKPWSNVLEINAGKEPIYLKQTPRDLFLEAAIIKFLRNQCNVSIIPEIVAENQALHCFLTKKCGDISLRDYFNGKLQKNILIQGIVCYKKMQRATEQHINELISLGVPDWRLDKFPTHYKQLIADSEFLSNCGLSTKQQKKLYQYEDIVAALCKQLAEYHIHECFNHSDFHDNNILYHLSNQTTSIIDLGETAINHPFFSLAALLYDTKTRYGLNEDSTDYQALKSACYSDYLESNHLLRKAILIIELLLPLYLLLAHMRFATAICPTELGKITRMNDRARKAFIWFIKNIGVHYESNSRN
jgi:RimJ/RimL family protein N-acetyltransferase